MNVYLDELSDDVRGNLSKHLRLKRICSGVEVCENVFQVAVADIVKSKAYLAGAIAIEADKENKRLRWDTYYPNSNIFASRDNLSLPRGEGIGAFAHALTLLAVSERLEGIEEYDVCSSENATLERLGQMSRLGLRSVMSYGENLGAVLDYMRESRGVDVVGVVARGDAYKFLMRD